MKFKRLAIPEVILIEPRVHEDPRGFFLESYHQKSFAANGIEKPFVQDNHSQSARGVLRGLHFQIPPRAQGKLIRVIRGEVFDVVVDIRRRSPTFGRFVTEIISAENKKMMFIPEGFAHGYCALTEGTEFLYKVTDFYSPEHERGVLWNDPALAIPWPRLDCDYIFSAKDRQYPVLADMVRTGKFFF